MPILVSRKYGSDFSVSFRLMRAQRPHFGFGMPGTGSQVFLTWVHLPVVAHPICIHDVLKSSCELVGPVEGGWCHPGVYGGEDRGDGRATSLLQTQRQGQTQSGWLPEIHWSHSTKAFVQAAQAAI